MEKNTLTKFWGSIFPIMLTSAACGLFCLLSWQWFIVGCMWWECADNGYFVSQEIQIPREYFPDGAVYGNLGPGHDAEGARQREAQTVWWGDNSRAILRVARFPGTERAKQDFALRVRILRQMFEIPSGQSEEPTYESALANQVYMGCGRHRVLGSVCVFVARYDEDLITLNMSIDEQMAQKDFERIVAYLDTAAAHRLGH